MIRNVMQRTALATFLIYTHNILSVAWKTSFGDEICLFSHVVPPKRNRVPKRSSSLEQKRISPSKPLSKSSRINLTTLPPRSPSLSGTRKDAPSRIRGAIAALKGERDKKPPTTAEVNLIWFILFHFVVYLLFTCNLFI